MPGWHQWREKQLLSRLNAPPCVKQWPLNCPATFSSARKIYLWNLSLRACNARKTKRYLKSLAGTTCFGRSERSSVGSEGGGGGEGGTRGTLAVCFSRKWLFVSFSTEGLLRVRRASLQIRETDSVAIHSSDNLKAVWHSLHGHRWFAVVKTPWLYTRLRTDTHWKWITVHGERLWWSENCRAPFTVKFIVLLQAEQGGLSIVV